MAKTFIFVNSTTQESRPIVAESLSEAKKLLEKLVNDPHLWIEEGGQG